MAKESQLWTLVRQHLPKDAHVQRIETGLTDFFVRSAHELLEIFGDQQSVMESFIKEGETMH